MTAHQVRRTPRTKARDAPVLWAASAHDWRAVLRLTSGRQMRSICAEAEG